MKTFERQQMQKAYDRFDGQDHGTRHMDTHWNGGIDTEMQLQAKDKLNNHVFKQEVADGLLDYKIPVQRTELSDNQYDIDGVYADPDGDRAYDSEWMDEVEKSLKNDEDITIEQNNFDNDESYPGEWMQYNPDQNPNVLPLISSAIGRRRKVVQATLDHELDIDKDFGDFPYGMHITNRP